MAEQGGARGNVLDGRGSTEGADRSGASTYRRVSFHGANGAEGELNVVVEHWPVEPAWLEYVKRVWQGHGRVELKDDDTIERLQFRARAEVGFIAQGFDFRTVKTYVNVMTPEPAGDTVYAEGYPHRHEPPDALTLVHYLDPGESAASLDLFSDEGCYIRSITPKAGLTVYLPNSQLHGVRRNIGETTRYALIATALPN